MHSEIFNYLTYVLSVQQSLNGWLAGWSVKHSETTLTKTQQNLQLKSATLSANQSNQIETTMYVSQPFLDKIKLTVKTPTKKSKT